jgi:hypothetical protein
MILDKLTTFFENVTATKGDDAVEAVKTGGADYARTFIAATLPEGTTSLTLTVKTGETEEDLVEVAKKTSTAQELAAGVMAIPTPIDLGKVTKVIPTVDGTLEKGIVCGITDAVPNAILMK